MGAIAAQNRTSKTRKRKRHAHFKLTAPALVSCPNCGELKLQHQICPNCGYYDGKQVLDVKSKEEKKADKDKADAKAKAAKDDKKVAKKAVKDTSATDAKADVKADATSADKK